MEAARQKGPAVAAGRRKKSSGGPVFIRTRSSCDLRLCFHCSRLQGPEGTDLFGPWPGPTYALALGPGGALAGLFFLYRSLSCCAAVAYVRQLISLKYDLLGADILYRAGGFLRLNH